MLMGSYPGTTTDTDNRWVSKWLCTHFFGHLLAGCLVCNVTCLPFYIAICRSGRLATFHIWAPLLCSAPANAMPFLVWNISAPVFRARESSEERDPEVFRPKVHDVGVFLSFCCIGLSIPGLRALACLTIKTEPLTVGIAVSKSKLEVANRHPITSTNMCEIQTAGGRHFCTSIP